MKAFRVKDLMINVIPQRSGGGGGTSMPGPDDDVTEFTPTTPIIVLPKYYAIVGDMIAKIGRLNPEVFDAAALDLGRQMFGLIANAQCEADMPTCRDLPEWFSRTAVFGRGVAQCTEDMPTCNYNEPLSWVAEGIGLKFEDLVIVNEFLKDLVPGITRLENQRLDLARKEAGKWVPKLEGVIDELKKPAK